MNNSNIEQTDDIDNFFNFGKPTNKVESKVSQKPVKNSDKVQTITEKVYVNNQSSIETNKKDSVQNFTDENVKTTVISRTNEKEFKKSLEDFDQDSGMEYVGEIKNIPTRKFYPERKFDTYAKKDCRLEEHDLEVLRAWCNQIAYKRRKSGVNGSYGRITDNTVIRILLSEFINKLSAKINSDDCLNITKEEELQSFISNFFK